MLCAAWMIASRRTDARAAGISSFRWPTRDDTGPILGLLLFFIGYVYVMFFGDELVGIDFAHFTVSRFIEPIVYPESGRFFPLALQEYNLLNALGKSAALYHAWATIELLVIASCVVFLLRETPLWYRVLVIVYLLALPSLAFSFMSVLYVERDMVFCIALWLVSIEWFRRSQSRVAFAVAVVVAQLLLYQKETAFVLIGGFAGASLLLRRADFRQQRYAEWARTNALELAHLAMCGVFLTVYLVAILPHVTASYAAGRNTVGAASGVLLTVIRSDPVLLAAAAVLLWRVGRRRALDELWDPLLVGALAFAATYVKLGLARDYYFAPADFIAALYLARIIYQTLPAWPRVAVAGLCLALMASFARNVSNNAAEWLGRRLTVDAYVALSNFLRRQAESRPEREITLFFPQAGGFQVMELAAFLHFKGWTATDGPAPRVAHGPSFALKTRHRYPNDRCFMSQLFQCRVAASPSAGDLIVFLPGRSVSAADLARSSEGADAMFHHEPRWSLTTRAMRALALGEPSETGLFEAYVLRSRGAPPPQ